MPFKHTSVRTLACIHTHTYKYIGFDEQHLFPTQAVSKGTPHHMPETLRTFLSGSSKTHRVWPGLLCSCTIWGSRLPLPRDFQTGAGELQTSTSPSCKPQKIQALP